MSDRWTAIRRRAQEVLELYARTAGHHGQAPAFTPERGSHAVLPAIACRALSDAYHLRDDENLPSGLVCRLNLQDKSIAVSAALDASQRAFVAAHAIGHLALQHPPHRLRGDAETVDGIGAANLIEEVPAHIDEQPHVAALIGSEGVLRDSRSRACLELEANVFAAELLAPLNEVRARTQADANWTVEGLAAYFGLSKAAMCHQLVAALLACPESALDAGHNARRLPHAPAECATEPAPESVDPPPSLDVHLSLDPKQREAAEITAPALVVAGPGAGKTRVLTARFIHLVRSGIDPRRILAVTFSNKAATEMQERLTAALPDHAADIQVFTFHALGLQLLTAYGSCLGYSQAPRLLSETDAFVFLRSRLHQLPLGQFEKLTDPAQFLEPLLFKIGRLKDDLISPAAFRTRVESWHGRLQDQPAPVDLAARLHHQEALATAAQCLDLAAVYETYQKWLHQEGYADYGDLIQQTLRLFAHPPAAEAIRESYQHILVDELQDINFACGQLVKAVDGGRQVVWAVADPRQSIYGFRGAALSNLARFEDDYPQARFVTLDANYRSVQAIVAAGQGITFPATVRGQAFTVPRLRSHREPQPGSSSGTTAVHASEAANYNQEIAEVVARVAEVSHTVPREDIAVLCHNKYLARDISSALEEAGMATTWSGQLEERDAFKDLMAVLLLAINQPQALPRLARLPAHRLDEADLRLLLNEARRRGHSLRAALYAGHQGEIEGLSDEGQKTASGLARLAFKLRKLPLAWQVLAAYLFEETTWARAHFDHLGPGSRRYLAAAGQLIELARQFALKGSPSVLQGAGMQTPELEGTAAFVDYLASLREAGTLPAAGASGVIADAVNVLTIHKSKGLEWPVVFVPDWTYATAPPAETVPVPSHLLRDAGTDSAAYSRSCLYYVAVTRARDRLFLSRSPRMNREPLPFWDDVITALEPRRLLECHTVKRAPWSRPAVESRAARLPQAEPISYAMIRQYQHCAQRAKYDYVYGLHAASGGYVLFVRRVRQTLKWLAEAAAAGTVPSASEIESYMESYVAGPGSRAAKAQRPLLPYYRDQVRRCALSFAARLEPGHRILLDAEWHYTQTGKPTVSFRIDEIESGPRPVVRLHRYGEPSMRDEEDPVLCFYAGLMIDDEPVEVRLHYLASGEEKVLDLAWDHLAVEKKMKEIYSAAYAIKNGHFEPKPRNRNDCLRCPHNVICPA